MQPHASAGASFHGHEDREVPRDDHAAHTESLVPCVAEEVSVDRDSLALLLVRPAGIVAEALDCKRDVDTLRDTYGLAVVQRFNLRELVLIALEQTGKLEDDIATRRALCCAPGLEGGTCSSNSNVNIGLVSLLHLADHSLGLRIHS